MGKTVVYPRDDRGVMGAPVTDNKTYIDGGLEVMSYRGIPIVESLIPGIAWHDEPDLST